MMKFVIAALAASFLIPVEGFAGGGESGGAGAPIHATPQAIRDAFDNILCDRLQNWAALAFSRLVEKTRTHLVRDRHLKTLLRKMKIKSGAEAADEGKCGRRTCAAG